MKILSFHLIFNFDILCEVIIATLNHKISPKKDQRELEIYISFRRKLRDI